ncbi:MAG: hypothetical protein AMXMBFR20_28410 [Planctomycetia bacterium]
MPSQRRNPEESYPRIWIDTETLGLFGIPYLIQFMMQGESSIQLIHVFEQAPSDVLNLIQDLVDSNCPWVGHNVMFDLVAISKLATVASMVSDWSFESVWEAERLWRGGIPYTKRLQHLRLVYPARVEDTMIAAMSLPPLEEQFLKSPAVHFNKMPVAVLPELSGVLRTALSQRPYYSDTHHAPDVGSWLKPRIDGATTRKEREQVRASQERRDFNDLRPVTLSFKPESAYSLKRVARLLGFPGPISDFSFLDDFGRMPAEPCPTIRDKGLARRLWDFVQKHRRDPEFLEYARRDVEMLAFVHQHYAGLPGYSSLEHDFQILPQVANQRLYGVFVDYDKKEATLRRYDARLDQARRELMEAGLANFNSARQVISFINRLMVNALGRQWRQACQPLRDMQDATLEAAHAMLLERVGENHKSTRLLRTLRQARQYAKRRAFFDDVVGDTLYPQFKVKGTQTDRMTSQRPCIQNMPARAVDQEDADGADFRAAFAAPIGYGLLIGDFDQFEMRLVAAVADDPLLQESFAKKVDTHALTALRTLEDRIRASDPSLADLSADELLKLLIKKDPRVRRFRGLGKLLNFAILYGASEYGVARQSGSTVEEARAALEAFHKAYPVLSEHVRAICDSLTVYRKDADDFCYAGWRLETPSATRLYNRSGVSRSCELPLRLVQILARLASAPNLDEHLPSLQGPWSASIRYYDQYRTPEQVVRAELRSAARRLQASIHRQGYNFLIQSLGACYTKRMQFAVARPHVPPGVHCAAALDVLPGINVHDELHFYSRIPAESLQDAAREYAEAISGELNVPIKFELTPVDCWAQKS